MGLINRIASWYNILNLNQLDSDQIREIQQHRLRRLLHHAAYKSEVYQDLYRGIDLEDCRIQDLPVMTKAAMMDNYDSFVADKRLKLNEIQDWFKDKQNIGTFYLGKFSPFWTSGTSGINALITYHRKAIDIIQANLFANYPFQSKRSKCGHIHNTASYFFGKKPHIAVIMDPRGNINRFFKGFPKLYRSFIDLKILSMLDPLDQIVDALNEFKPDQLVSYSFFIALLAQEQLAGRLNLDFNHPMSFITGCGEVLTKHTQELSSRAWNMSVQDTYGAMECYLMATSCSMYNHLHLMSHLCIIEIVDRKYRPVPMGQYGEKILLTNLFNYTQPIIRYEIEDITGYSTQSCACGSPFPVLLPVQGRTIDFFYFKKPEGGYDQFPPTILEVSLFYMHEVRQYQIVQTERNELTFYYVPQSKPLNIEDKLRKMLSDALSQRDLAGHVELNIKQVETIPRHKSSGKYRSMVSLAAPSDLYTI